MRNTVFMRELGNFAKSTALLMRPHRRANYPSSPDMCLRALIAECQKTAYISDRRLVMPQLTNQILEYAKQLPEGYSGSCQKLASPWESCRGGQSLVAISRAGPTAPGRAGRLSSSGYKSVWNQGALCRAGRRSDLGAARRGHCVKWRCCR